MKAKEQKYRRDKDLLEKHPQLQHRMRAILLDWIIEVSATARGYSCGRYPSLTSHFIYSLCHT